MNNMYKWNLGASLEIPIRIVYIYYKVNKSVKLHCEAVASNKISQFFEYLMARHKNFSIIDMRQEEVRPPKRKINL